MLKSIHICLSVTAMIAVVFLGTAHAQSGDSASHSQIQKQRQSPLVKTRADNHRSRIKQGVKSGELTQGETRRLVRQQRRIRQNRRQYILNDGKLSKAERASLQRQQTRASLRIFKAKHNRVKRR